MFCSRRCSGIYNGSRRLVSETQKSKTSESIKKYLSSHPSTCIKYTKFSETRSCKVCGNNYTVTSKNKNKQYCTVKCANKFSGGYREGSGRSKAGYYKNIYSGSTYELCWIIYQLDHGIEFKRFPGCIKNETLKYYPDFILGDGKTIVEIKGYEDHVKVFNKKKLAEDQGYIVTLLYKEDLQHIFEYVKKVYGTSKFEVLYD